MEQVLLEFIEWGKVHWWFFGWTAFWCLLAIANGMFKLPMFITNRVLRTVKVLFRGWPPEHLDADGDWRPDKPIKLDDDQFKELKRVTRLRPEV